MKFQVGHLTSFLRNRRLRVVVKGKSLQKYSVNDGIPQGSTLGLALFLLYTDDLPDDVMCNIAIYDHDNTLSSK